MKFFRREGLTLNATSAWTMIASYKNDSDDDARVISLGHCYHDNSLWKLQRDTGALYVPEWDIQLASTSYPFNVDILVEAHRTIELWAKNNDVASHVYEGVLVYEGAYDQRSFIGSERCEKTFGMSVTTLGDISTDLIPAITNTYKLGSATKYWLEAYIKDLYLSGGQKRVSVYLSANQSVNSDTWTKVALNTEVFDLDSVFDNVTNYRYTPAVAGYYLITGRASLLSPVDQKNFYLSLYINGARAKDLFCIAASGTTEVGGGNCVLLYLGATDYVELWVWHYMGVAKNIAGTILQTYFTACKSP